MGSSSDVGFESTVGDKQSLSEDMESMPKRPCQLVLEEKTDIYQPTEEELLEYARWLGMKIPQDMDLIWIARDGLTRPLPAEWKPCQTEDDEIYYFNFETGESVWDHPCDGLCRKLYQEECMRLGKRPYQMVESASCSSQLQQLTNWGEEATERHPPHQAYFDEMVNEKEMHSPEGSFCQTLSPQERKQAEIMPSSKEIQMNIVEKEIDALKDIRAQLLQKMSALWQEEEYRPSTSQMVIEGAANYNERKQDSISLLEGNIYKHPSAEVGNFIELGPQQIGQDWSEQHEEEKEDPRKTKERTDLLRTQLEMAKTDKLQIPNKIDVANIHNLSKLYKDQSHESESSSMPPIMYAGEVSQEANSEANENKFALDEGVDVSSKITTKELKKANLVVRNGMKEKLISQLSKIDGMERSTIEDEYQLALSRKKAKMELLQKELRKDMEFQLLLEEESILKRKRVETLARLHNHIEGEGFAEQGNIYGRVSPYMHSVLKGCEQKLGADEDLKELFMQWTKELKDEVVSLKTKMNEILVLHANTNQQQFESPSVLPVTSEEDICKASSDFVPTKKNSIEFIYTLRRILGELDVNLKHLLKNQGIELKGRNNVSDIIKKLEDSGLPKNLDKQPNLLHTNYNIVNTQDTSPDVISTNLLYILKEFLVVLDEEMEKNISHYEEVSQNEKSSYFPSKIVDKELDLKNNHILPMEIVKIIKGIITKIETHMNRVIIRQERGSLDNPLGLELAFRESLSSNDGLQPQSNFLNEDIHKMMLDMHGMITQFKAVLADMLSSFKEFVGELEGEMKERTQQPKREVNYNLHGFKPQYVGKGDGQDKSRGQQILPRVDDTRETLELTSEEIRSLEGLPIETLDTLEGFIGPLHQELKDRISCQGKKVQKDNACTQMDAKPIVKHNTILQLQETSLQEDLSMFYEDEVNNKLKIPNISSSALSTNTLRNLKGFVDELHRETNSSIQSKKRNIEERNPNSPTRSTLEETHFSIPYKGKHEAGPIPPVNDCEEVPQEQNLELHTLSAKTLSAFENFRKNLNKEIHDIVLGDEGEPNIEKYIIKPRILDGPSASFSEETNFGTWSTSITCNRFDKYLDAKLASFDVMFTELKRFFSKVEELKTTIQKFKRELKHENNGMRSKMNNLKVHEFFSQTAKSELQSHSLVPIFQAWSIQIEKSIEDLLQHFKSELMEEMNMLQQEKVKDPSCLRSRNCHELQSPKSDHLTQVPTLVAEEKRVWYDILNDATKQWLQKEWVERLEHQSELTTTCDHSTSPPSSEHLTQVQKVLGEEKNIMFDILNHSTHKWVVQQRNPLQLESRRISHCKEGVEISSMSHKSHSKYGQSPPLTSKARCCQISEELDTKKNHSRKGSHTSDILHGDEDEESKLFTHGSKVVKCCPHNFDSCHDQHKSAQEDGNKFSHEFEELQEYEEAKLPHNNPITNNNLSCISQWIPKFGALNHTNTLGFSQDGEIHEDYHKQNIISQAEVFPTLHEKCNNPSFKCKNNNMHTYGLSTSRFDKDSKLYSDGNLFESGNTRETQRISDKIQVLRSISQLKLVSRKGWQKLQSKLRVMNAKRRAHIIVSWTFQQISCGLIPKMDTSYLAYTILKFIKATMGKMACGETHQSANAENLQANMAKDYDAENILVDVSKMNIMHISACNPLMKPHLTRSGQLKFESRDQTTSHGKEVYYDKHNPFTQDGDIIYNSTKWNKLDYFPKMMDDRNKYQWNHDDEFHKVESITNSFAKFQCDNDLEMSIVEDTQCDCETPVMRGVNSKEVDMHELEEAINNLRKGKEIEAKDMAFRIDHYPLNDKDFLDETSHLPNTKPTPFQQREKICHENLDLTNRIHVDDHALCNGMKHQENDTNGSIKGKIPNFITFEFLQQGEIALPKNREFKTH